MAYEEEEDDDYAFRLPTDLATVPVLKLVSGLSWSASQSDFDRVAAFLQQAQSTLRSTHAQLKHEHSALMSSHAQLEHEHSALMFTHAQLEQEHSALRCSHAQLQKDNSVLRSNNATLKRNNLVLKSKSLKLDSWKMKCGELEREVEMLKVKPGCVRATEEGSKSPVPVLLERGSENSQVKSGEKSLTLENGRKITESMIRQIFSPYGEIVDIELMQDQSSLSKGLCFVRYSRRESAIDVKRHKNEVEMGGKRIGVDLSLDQNGLFFGNLKKEWSLHHVDQLIRQAFRDVLSVEFARNLVPEVSSGLRCSNRGFAFVHFLSHEAAAQAYHIGSRPDFTLDGDLHPSIEWYLPQAEFDLAEMAKSKVAYVGHLPPAANEEYLRKLFGRTGKVDKIVLSRNKSGTVGYLHFATRNGLSVQELYVDLERAIEEMNGKTIGTPYGGPPFKIKVEVARIPAKRKVHTGDGVIKAQIKSLSMSNKRCVFSPDVPVAKARRIDKMAICIDSLPPVLKERLLRVFHLRIATEHDIDLHCVNGLKELPEASAISVLDKFLFSGADKHDKRSFFNSLVAEKRRSWSASSASPHQSDYLSRLDQDRYQYTLSRNMSRFCPVSSERGQIRNNPGAPY